MALAMAMAMALALAMAMAMALALALAMAMAMALAMALALAKGDNMKDFYPYCSDTEKRNQIEESYRNIEKCAVCGKEHYGHHEEHAFKGSWEDDKNNKGGNNE
jgi:predicted secreted acid phosphatase